MASESRTTMTTPSVEELANEILDMVLRCCDDRTQAEALAEADCVNDYILAKYPGLTSEDLSEALTVARDTAAARADELAQQLGLTRHRANITHH
jgi:hypothetical protein